MNLPKFGVTHPVPVNLLMAVLLIAGIYSAITLTREFFPDITPESATVNLPYPGATPEEIEESLAQRVEDKLVDLDEVEKITTTLAEGGGGIVVEFRDGVDLDKAVDDVEREVDRLTDLPEDAERIQVAEVEPRLPVIMVTLFGTADEEIKKRAVRRIREDLERLPGMGEIVISGVRDYEVRVDVSADALLEHKISLPQVADAVTAWMADVPGGSIRTDTGNINVRTMGVREGADEIRKIVVKATTDGQLLRLEDIATVREDYVDVQIETRFSSGGLAGPSASLTVYRVGDQDAVEIAEMVRSYVNGRRGAPFDARISDRLATALDAMMEPMAARGRQMPEFRTKRQQAYGLGASSLEPIPAGCELATHSDLARFIEGRLDLLIRNARWGALLVFATLLFFLNWRVALWVGVGLTVALCGTLWLMSVAGVTLNLLTMFGLIVVLGLLVDDAIVVAENIQARHDRGEPSLVAAVRGTNEVFWPVVATVITSIVAFLPLTVIKGSIGDMLGALPMVVCCALVMSLIESVLILPSHMGHSLVDRDRLEKGGSGSWVHRFESWRDRIIQERIIAGYAALLELAMRRRYTSLAIATSALMIASGVVAGGRLEFTFLPESDSETIIVDVRMPTGTSLDETRAAVQLLEAAAASQPETRSVSTLVGVRANVDEASGIAAAGQGTHIGQLFLELLAVEQRSRESADVIASIREEVGAIDNAESVKYSEIQAGPGGADFTVQVTGDDEAAVGAVVEEVKRLLAEFDGVFDISDDRSYGQREIQITLKPGSAALGFDVADVARQVRGALYGIDAHVFAASREDIDVRVRLDERSRRSLAAIENIWLINRKGDRVPLGEIASLEEGASYNSIKRVDRERAVTVTADTAPGTNPEAIVPQLTPSFARIQQLYPGVGIELAGRQRQLNKAMSSLPIGFGAALVMIYVILAWLFGSYAQPLAVMLAIPFGTIGVVWGHTVLGYPLTFLSLIGFVALSGIVVNDSLIFVQFSNDRRREGAELHEALLDAGRKRLRPIFLTTVTTVLGLTPLMLERSFQARLMIPMAISISFGLLSATVLILLVLPCILVIFDDIKGICYYLWHGLPRPRSRPGDARRPEIGADAV